MVWLRRYRVDILTPNELKLLRLRCIATKRSMSSSDCAGHSGDDGAICVGCGDFGGVAIATSFFGWMGERLTSNEFASSKRDFECIFKVELKINKLN